MNAASHIWAGEETETPWRFRLQEMAWRDLVDALKHDDLPFVGLWCDGTDVHALFLPDGQPLAATLALEDGRYPALSPARDISCLYERRIYDLYGAEGMWATDVRPLLDHDVWSSSTPLAEHPGAGGGQKGLIHFQPAEHMHQEGDMADGWGPATGGMEPPLHVALAMREGRIRAAETVTGYAHRGMELRWRNSRVEDACKLSARVAAGQSVAHQVAFCLAVEDACKEQVGPEIRLLRVALLELERICHHLFLLADMARLAGARLVASGCMGLREKLIQEAAPITGSRLLMDVCVPGGLSLRHATQMGDMCGRLCEVAERDYPTLLALWQEYPGLSMQLAGIGKVTADLLERVGLDGPTARAAGWDCDGRRMMPGYEGIWRFTSGRQDGTAEDRAMLLLEEVGESLRMLDEVASRIGLTAGGSVQLSMQDSEGTGMVEGPWGGILYWVRLKEGRVEQVFARNPSSAALLTFEAILPGHQPDDVALLARSLDINAAALDQ